ncbi:hypothetical protein [Halorarius litoreus]|uniref:hypothetical protein n=1 Tax=Halorarius litoreus TaxID=2962676 RepID=UPI0020CF6D59|nr:hypothetical protein [Halorarius litoreus]
MVEDWDTLLVLDGCRADLFEDVSNIRGTYRTVNSMGTHTGEFLRSNFADDQFLDTVYLSANPQLINHDVASNFYACEFLWETCWDDSLATVPPEKVTERLLRATEKYPDKRIIAHYIQPHYPFIGETGQAIEHGSITGNGVIANEREHPTVWSLLEDGMVKKSLVWQAYRENLEIVLDAIDDALEELDGKTVITADHGNALGEWGLYGHPGERHVKSLTEVPWLELEFGERRTIVEGKNRQVQASESTIVNQRLEDLGYLTE